MQTTHAGWLMTLLILLAADVFTHAGEPATGWRGNGTGLWPDAKPPLEWHRIPHGALDGLRASAQRPIDEKPGEAPLVLKGLLRDWVIIGPFKVDDSVKDLDRDLLGGEAAAEPTPEQKAGELTWKSATVPPDDILVFGTAEMPWLDFVESMPFARNQVAYANTYLYSPRGGPARIVINHAHGLKAFVNGKEVYRAASRNIALGYYTHISNHELQHMNSPSPRFDIELKKGWNRLLLKVSTSNKDDWKDMRCGLRIIDPPDVAYETKNIKWMTPLSGRSTSTPIIAGDRVFVMAEPDELICIEKRSGKVLWSQAANYYTALTDAERAANPAFAAKIDPLLAMIKAETDRVRRTRLRAELSKELLAIDASRFKIDANDHFEAHFGIVGFTMPTPVSDGKHVFVWCGLGVAACFDLDGKRRWITRVPTDHLSYGSSPALADGVLAVYLNGLYGLDAASGKVLWTQPAIRNNIGAVLATTFAGKQVFVMQRGDIVDPADGRLLFRPQGSEAPGDTGWAPPVVLGDHLYSPKYGISELSIYDFSEVKHNKEDKLEKWKPKLVTRLGVPRELTMHPDGRRVDRWSAGSPLIHDGLAYQVDIYQALYVTDIKTGTVHYRHDLELEGFTHYNAVAVAASPTLVGGHVYICDNQGTMLVIEPGPKYKVVARNRIATQLDRPWPIPAQETIGYAPPIADGDRLYIRGEAYLYCIGAQ